MFKKTIKITPEEAGVRIDKLCGQLFSQLSRSRWQNYGKFYCNSIAKTNKTRTQSGDVWNVECEEESPISENLVPWNYPLIILKETENWVAIEKPVGLSVHPSSSENSQKTIINALLYHFGKNLSENFDEIEGKRIPRPGLVHRLDKVTSGILLIAKNNKTHRTLQENWNQTKKTYCAVVHGTPPKKGKIEGAIFRDPKNRKKMTVSKHEKSKEAITFFENLGTKKNFSLLKINIPTGRTHQIRVHLSAIGFPILGDILYGGDTSERVFLHAETLIFPDPQNPQHFIKIESAVPDIFYQKSICKADDKS